MGRPLVFYTGELGSISNTTYDPLSPARSKHRVKEYAPSTVGCGPNTNSNKEMMSREETW